MYPIVRSLLILLSSGMLLVETRVLPRGFGYAALPLGAVYPVVSVIGLVALPLPVVIVLGLQVVWVLAAGLVQVFAREKAAQARSPVLGRREP